MFRMKFVVIDTVAEGNLRLFPQTAGRIVPFPKDFLRILCNVLQKIVDGAVVILINWNTGGKAPRPVLHIIDRLAAIC